MGEFIEKRIRIQSILYGKLKCVNCGGKIKGVRYWVKSDDPDDDQYWCRYCVGVEKGKNPTATK